MTPPRIAAVKAFWETLSPTTLAALSRVYTADAYFRDPFNEVRDRDALQRILEDMFEKVDEPRFVIHRALDGGQDAVLLWDFTFRMKKLQRTRLRTIQGASHLRFDEDGRVTYHRDYWDAAGELFAHFPLIGPVLRGMGVKASGKAKA